MFTLKYVGINPKEEEKMKKIFCFCLLVMGCLMLASCNCGKKTYEIALVTDVGNIDDGSFNEGAWNGVKEYAEDHDISYQYYRPSEDSTDSRVETMKTAIDNGAKIVVCPGYLFEEAIFNIQGTYPEVAFLLLDGQPHNADYSTYKTESNTHCILYQEEQAGYFAGYAAVMDGYRSLGFLGGLNVPAVIRFGYGYVQGADAAANALNLADGAVTIKYNYAGTFNPSDSLKSKMDGWYASGTQIVFSCGGGIYLSVTQAASQASGKVIGVDVDQSNKSDTIITSAEKKLTQSVKLALDSFYANEGKWDTNHAGKTANLGVNEDCVGLPTATSSWKFTKFTVTEYQTLYNKVKDGTVVVWNGADPDVKPTFSAKVVVDWAA